MFEIYFATIFLWMVIIMWAVEESYEPAMKNGWGIDPPKSTWYDVVQALILLFVLSAIPIVRLLFVVGCYVLSKYTEKQVDEWIENLGKK